MKTRTAMQDVALTSALRALERAEEALIQAGEPMAAMRVGAVIAAVQP